MIIVNELRIGNCINRLGVPTTITAIEINGEGFGYVSTKSSGAITFNQIEPIPLTEELLLKCGFEKYLKKDVYFKKGDSFELHQFNKYGHFSYVCGDNLEGNFISIRIDWLHQLQNLYFALMGRELTISL